MEACKPSKYSLTELASVMMCQELRVVDFFCRRGAEYAEVSFEFLRVLCASAV